MTDMSESEITNCSLKIATTFLCATNYPDSWDSCIPERDSSKGVSSKTRIVKTYLVKEMLDLEIVKEVTLMRNLFDVRA